MAVWVSIQAVKNAYSRWALAWEANSIGEGAKALPKEVSLQEYGSEWF